MIAIQAFAGHEHPQTTEKYMHLAPGLVSAAVRLFDAPSVARALARVDGRGEKA
jgi:hypothetical protein